MASVFRIKSSGRYAVDYTDADGRRRRKFTRTRRKRDACRIADEIERRVLEIRNGIRTPVDVIVDGHLERPIREHLIAFRRHMRGKGDSDAHIRQVTRRLERLLFRSCKVVVMADLSRRCCPGTAPIDESVLRYLDGPWTNRGKPFAISTRNTILGHLRHFCRWAIENDRLDQTALLKLRPKRHDGQLTRERRALSEDELTRLLLATASRTDRSRLSGRDRAMLYRVAVETGLRRGELASIKPPDIVLDGPFPHIRVHAMYTKNRKMALQPIPPSLVNDLKDFLRRRPIRRPIWEIPKHAAAMLGRDLQAAGISYRDDRGRFADFHALRHTYVTRLALAGVPIAHGQRLARHSKADLTLSYYTHIERSDLTGQLTRLRSLHTGDAD